MIKVRDFRLRPLPITMFNQSFWILVNKFGTSLYEGGLAKGDLHTFFKSRREARIALNTFRDKFISLY